VITIGRRKRKGVTKAVAEGLILSKLYRDGIFTIDEKAKTVEVESRKSVLEERYTSESYSDVFDIIKWTSAGLRQQGYTVTVHVLERG
jgi:hypothetical protein